ncbi:beta-ketoacyl-ACP synthase III [Clostridium intestinale]|uniref:beta-ketoacyl-ACP synthase III n=1 Tax=Clostridium intestinale TaxID=36845 RepID=UPI0028ECF45A|nr:beta-ketoacyl-ACP synthase III [Clostridium intestinale]
MLYSKMLSIGGYAPSNVVINEDLSKIMDTSDEWIISRTGIKERRISETEDCSDLAYNAANIALEKSGVKAEDLDLIIVATVSPDAFCPSVACLVQDKLKAVNATAFDLNAACSGFVYGLITADALIKTGNYKKALVIGSEVLSKLVDWEDRTTAVLFGDGAGAAILSASEEQGLVSGVTSSKGDKWMHLTAGALDVASPYSKIEEKKKKTLSMNGREVFKFATGVMVENINNVLEKSGLTLNDIDHIVPHQANVRIIDFVAKKLELPLEKFYINLDRYGNTSSASIPLALNEMDSKGLLKKGQKIILVGFGAGLTSGALIINW